MAVWVLVADRGRARIFEIGTDESLTEVACFSNPEGRAAGRELTRDRPPTVNESVGSARHRIEPHTTLHDKVSARFARTLCDALDRGHAQGRFEALMLIAPPRFLGDLHAALGKALRGRVVDEIRHDLTELPVQELQERIARQPRR
jgi:protein required for attachment to host cells